MAPSTALLLLVASALVDAGPGPADEPRPVEPPADDGADIVDGGVPAGIPGVTVSAKVEPDPVPFGARFELVVTVLRDRGQQLELPASLPATEAAPHVYFYWMAIELLWSSLIIVLGLGVVLRWLRRAGPEEQD